MLSYSSHIENVEWLQIFSQTLTVAGLLYAPCISKGDFFGVTNQLSNLKILSNLFTFSLAVSIDCIIPKEILEIITKNIVGLARETSKRDKNVCIWDAFPEVPYISGFSTVSLYLWAVFIKRTLYCRGSWLRSFCH